MQWTRHALITTAGVREQLREGATVRFVLWSDPSAKEMEWILVLRSEETDYVLVSQQKLQVRAIKSAQSALNIWTSFATDPDLAEYFPDPESRLFKLPVERDEIFDYDKDQKSPQTG